METAEATAPTLPSSLPFAESSPLGLLGLAVGCAALLPVAFGQAVTPDALRTAAMFCLLFGGGCQLVAGLMALANKNLLGGTLFTTFAFNWAMNYWSLTGLADGRVPNHHVVFAVDVCFIVIFTVLMFAFGYFSKLLFAFSRTSCCSTPFGLETSSSTSESSLCPLHYAPSCLPESRFGSP